MPRARQLNIRKKTGLALLGVVLLYWIAVPILPFTSIPNKAFVIPALVVIGEIVFVAAVALLGKEYWAEIKGWATRRFSRKSASGAGK
ncbi:transporter suffix domain-containing protein [Burkholderia orbicola]|uniref:Transporter suffix domain-containing protein n=1 Tax=Burkholderia orbicola TaxID=2978683 RepID=A0ABT8NQE1_9BURK|nr:transporter suffix domain-containing protein [Burkholderia orbicola]MDN7523552.1 transporter suffix domain-containing protein [Burkholderia orbicola]